MSAARRALVGLITAVLVLGLGAAAASGQEEPYNPDPPQVSLADSEVCEGESVVVTVSDVDPGDSITVTFGGESASLTAGAGGTASTSFGTAGTGAGTFSVGATTGAGASSSASVTVIAEDDCNPGPPSTISIADPEVCQGDNAVATVSGGTPGGSVTIAFAGESVVVVIGGDGTASTSFPTSGLTPGEYAFVVTDGSGASASAPLFVLSLDSDACRPDVSNPTLAISADDTCASAPVVVTVTGAEIGENVTVSLTGTTATVTAGADGSGQASLPTDGLEAGVYDLLATSTSGGGASAQVALHDGTDGCAEVLGGGTTRTPPAAPGSDPLALTGSTVWPLATAGTILIGLGVALTWRSRRSKAA